MKAHQIHATSRQFAWELIWKRDRYSRSTERAQRAIKRISAFELANSIGNGAALLDVGCGSGETLSLLHQSWPSCRLFGVDRSNSALRLACERHPNSSAKYICADVQQLPFVSDTFDAVTAFGIVEHIAQHRLALAEIARVLKPGATLYLSTSNAASFLQIFNRLRALAGWYPYGYQHNWTESELLFELHPFFEIDRVFRMHADSDMPVVRLLDRVMAKVLTNWSRYVCFRLRKRQ